MIPVAPDDRTPPGLRAFSPEILDEPAATEDGCREQDGDDDRWGPG
jgi:hypothetical protein